MRAALLAGLGPCSPPAPRSPARRPPGRRRREPQGRHRHPSPRAAPYDPGLRPTGPGPDAADHRCRRWGHKGSTEFSGWQEACRRYDLHGRCANTTVTRFYSCTDVGVTRLLPPPPCSLADRGGDGHAAALDARRLPPVHQPRPTPTPPALPVPSRKCPQRAIRPCRRPGRLGHRRRRAGGAPDLQVTAHRRGRRTSSRTRSRAGLVNRAVKYGASAVQSAPGAPARTRPRGQPAPPAAPRPAPAVRRRPAAPGPLSSPPPAARQPGKHTRPRPEPLTTPSRA